MIKLTVSHSQIFPIVCFKIILKFKKNEFSFHLFEKKEKLINFERNLKF